MPVNPKPGVVYLLTFAAFVVVMTGCSSPGSAATPTPSPLNGVPARGLEAAQVELQPATPQEANSATATADEVRATSLTRDPGATILDIQFMHFADVQTRPAFRCLCWVVATEPSAGIYLSSPALRDANGNPRPVPALVAENPVHLDVYDASGKFIMGVEGATGAHPK